MSNHYRLTVTSMTSHYLYITTPDDVDINKVCEHWRNFDGGDFSTDPDGGDCAAEVDAMIEEMNNG